MRRYPLLCAALALVFLGACNDGGGTTDIDATGTVRGLVWLDRNGNEELDVVDAPVEDVRVQLRRLNGSTVISTGVTSQNGELTLEDVPVGDYIASVDETTIGDTLSLLRIDSADVRVGVDDTTLVSVALTYPALSFLEARALPAETRVFTEGVALNGWATFGDSTIHLRDASGAIRIVRAQPVAIASGDSVRMLGTTSVRTGQVVLKDVGFYLLRTGTESPPAIALSTDEASSAQGGALDADLASIANAVIEDTAAVANSDYRLTVNDGTGPVVILLDEDVGFSLSFGTGGIIGRRVDATGLLVPDEQASGRWVLKPRSGTEITVLPAS